MTSYIEKLKNLKERFRDGEVLTLKKDLNVDTYNSSVTLKSGEKIEVETSDGLMTVILYGQNLDNNATVETDELIDATR